MSKKSEVLKADLRKQPGTRQSRRLRAEGRIPGCLNQDDKHGRLDIHIEEHNFLGTRRRHTHLYEIEVEGEKELQMAVVRELQWDTFGEKIIHIDFKRVQRNVKTESEVELEFVGTPKGGILNHLVTHVTVNCVPLLIPDSIEVQVGKLELGNSVYMRDLVMPEGVELVGEPDEKVAVVVLAARPEVEAAPAEGEDGAAAPTAGTVAAPAAKPAAGAAAKPAAPAKPAKG